MDILNELKKPYRLVKCILKLEKPLPSKSSNFEYNQVFWNRHAKSWDKTRDPVENPDIPEYERVNYINYLGDEWGKVSDVSQIVTEYIYPYISKESIVAEIGVGGGRIASKVADKTKEFHCFDISSEMLKRAKSVLSKYSNIHYILLNRPKLPDRYEGYFDFVYSFDVFVHLDLHTMWKYFCEIKRTLKNGGKAFIHTTNLKTPGGWKRFSSQKEYSPEYHYFISPEIVQLLAQHCDFEIIKTSCVDPNNTYFYRDYLAILQK
jgi:ubiquinone/menaquinone biosynthesis C-methylase UbiE